MASRRVLRRGFLVGMLVPVMLCTARGQAVDAAAAALVQAAGQAASDAERLAALQTLAALPNLEPALRADVDKLLPVMAQWVKGPRLDAFDRPFRRDPHHDLGIAESSPLHALACFMRARMVIWTMLEYGGILQAPGIRDTYIGAAVAAMRVAREAFPGNRIARMYLGEPIPWEKRFEGGEGAPPWAVLQRESLERLADIITWWIDHRMQADAQYGGGWGDDCEMWRWWVPVLLGFDDPKITAAQARFSTALMNLPHMQGGYTSKITDVEHTAEDSADVITPMMHLMPEDPAWAERARRLATLMETLWTGRNERGHLQFKSTYFAVDRVSERPEQACDTVYHPRAVQPALLLWQRTGDERLGRLFTAWMDTWVDAAARDERGKPAGVVPSAIHWPSGRVGGLGENWWDPRNHSEPTLYAWPSAMTQMLDTLLLAYHMTQEERYLEPIHSMAAMRLAWRTAPEQSATPEPGSAAWCAQRLGTRLAGTLAKYRQLTGDARHDALLALDGPAGLGTQAGPDREALAKALEQTAAALRINFEGYTSEVRYTDRVLRFPGLFKMEGLIPPASVVISSPNTTLLYSLVTGDPGAPGYFPLNAVRWLTPPRDLAALVIESGADGFAAELYHFGLQRRPMDAELYLLRPGAYRLDLLQADGSPAGPSSRVAVTGPRTRVTFALPARQLCTLRLSPAPGVP